MRVILGLDPGLASTGIAVLRAQQSTLRYMHASVIHTDSDIAQAERLALIYEDIRETVRNYAPQEAGIESLYFAKNVSSALPVAMAMGAAMLALRHEGVPVYEYSPGEVKKSLTGISRASKAQVRDMVMLILGMRQSVDPSHASDALAVAITHAHHREGALHDS